MSHLFVVEVETKAIRRLTSGAFTVGRFDWSPDSRQIAFDHRINGDPANSGSADIAVVTVADGGRAKLVTRTALTATRNGRPTARRSRSRVRWRARSSSSPTAASRRFRRRAGRLPSCRHGSTRTRRLSDGRLPASSSRRPRAWAYLYRLDPATKAVTRLAPSERWIGSGFSLSADAQTVAFTASDASTFPEIYVAPGQDDGAEES